MAAQLGGPSRSNSPVIEKSAPRRSYRPTDDSRLLDGLKKDNRDAKGAEVLDVWMSRSDHVVAAAPGFKVIGSERQRAARGDQPMNRELVPAYRSSTQR